MLLLAFPAFAAAQFAILDQSAPPFGFQGTSPVSPVTFVPPPVFVRPPNFQYVTRWPQYSFGYFMVPGNRYSGLVPQSTPRNTIHLQSASDFCIMMPPVPNSNVGMTENFAVSMCLSQSSPIPSNQQQFPIQQQFPGQQVGQINPSTGFMNPSTQQSFPQQSFPGQTQVISQQQQFTQYMGQQFLAIPSGFIVSAHFMNGPNYVQITGQINRAAYGLLQNDVGTEYSSDLFSYTAGSSCQGYSSYISFLEPDANVFCVRCCRPGGDCDARFENLGCVARVNGNYGIGFSNQGVAIPTPLGVGFSVAISQNQILSQQVPIQRSSAKDLSISGFIAASLLILYH